MADVKKHLALWASNSCSEKCASALKHAISCNFNAKPSVSAPISQMSIGERDDEERKRRDKMASDSNRKLPELLSSVASQSSKQIYVETIIFQLKFLQTHVNPFLIPHALPFMPVGLRPVP